MIGLGLSLFEVAVRATTPTPTPLISAINADGWSAEWASGTPPTFTPDTSPQTETASRQGFDATGAATTYTETRTFIRRKRQLHPNQASDTATTVAMDNYVYSTDTISGVTNSSAWTSPKPRGTWEMPDCQLVGNSIYVELRAFHRNGRSNRHVACIIVRATDGTNTVTTTISATSISPKTGDKVPMEVFAGTLDITSLNAGLITVNAKVYPWIGGAASVTDSADQTARREFSPRYFLKNVSRFTSPPLAYVASTGNDGTGVVSTTAATAKATPFLTVQGAINGLVAASGVTGGVVDGCRIRIVDSVSIGASATVARGQNVAAVIVERDPTVSKATANLSVLSAAWRARLGVGTLTAPITEGSILFRDLTITRAGNLGFTGEAGTQLQVMFDDDVAFNGGGNTGTMLVNAHSSIFGMTAINATGSIFGAAANYEIRVTRGLSVDINGGAIELWQMGGCVITRPTTMANRDPTKGFVCERNAFLNPNASAATVSISTVNAGETMDRPVMLNNLLEVTHTTLSTPAMRIGTDTPVHGHTYAAMIGHNTVTGYYSAGRHNNFYDNTPGEVRNHDLAWFKGELGVQFNFKGDVFTADATHIGNLALVHGVGCQGNISQYQTNSSVFSSEQQMYGGLGSKINFTSATTPQFANSSIWTSYQGTTGSGGTAVAGAGGGDYTLAVGSPAKGIVTAPVRAFDLAGAAVGSTDSAGAYA